MDQVIPAIEEPTDTKWVKHIKMKSDKLSSSLVDTDPSMKTQLVSPQIPPVQEGRLLLDQKEYDKAIDFFQKLQDQKPDDSEVLELLEISKAKKATIEQIDHVSAKLAEIFN